MTVPSKFYSRLGNGIDSSPHQSVKGYPPLDSDKYSWNVERTRSLTKAHFFPSRYIFVILNNYNRSNRKEKI